MEILRPTHLKIDLDQIAANYNFLAGLSKNNFVCPMLKANAYGHGAVEVAKRLVSEGCTSIGVALYEEALELREAGITQPQILVFAPMTKKTVGLSFRHNLTPVLLSDGDIEHLKAETSDLKINVHLKINFEMNRLGFHMNKAKEIIAELNGLASVNLTGLCTHFPTSENLLEEGRETSKEIDQFLEFCQSVEVSEVHALNSATVLGLHFTKDSRIHQLGMRPGIALYGAPPDMGEAAELPIDEAMTLCTEVVHLQNVKKNQGVSYMGQWVAPEDSLIGVLPIGYADGLRRGLSGRLNITVEGQDCPQVGIICMDYIMVNLTNAELDKPLGAKVTISGIQSMAHELNGIPYEIMTGMSSRLPRLYS